MGFEEMVDRNLQPPEDNIVGYDWKGGELYGNEHGFMIEGEFVVDDDIYEYIEGIHELAVSSDVMKIDKYNI